MDIRVRFQIMDSSMRTGRSAILGALLFVGHVEATTTHFTNNLGGTVYGFTLDDQAVTINFDPVTILAAADVTTGRNITGFHGFAPYTITATVTFHSLTPAIQLTGFGPLALTAPVSGTVWGIGGFDAQSHGRSATFAIQENWSVDGTTDHFSGNATVNLPLQTAAWLSSIDLANYPNAAVLNSSAGVRWSNPCCGDTLFDGSVDGVSVHLGASAFAGIAGSQVITLVRRHLPQILCQFPPPPGSSAPPSAFSGLRNADSAPTDQPRQPAPETPLLRRGFFFLHPLDLAGRHLLLSCYQST
jgi:hypothetical protein